MSFVGCLEQARAELAERSADPWCTKLEDAVRNIPAISSAALLDLLRVPATTGTARRLARNMRSIGFIPIKSRRLMPGGFRDTVTRGWARPVREIERRTNFKQGEMVGSLHLITQMHGGTDQQKGGRMIYDIGHPHVTAPDWQTFRKEFSPLLIREVINRSEIKLPDWFVPLARGVAIASDTLLLKSGYRCLSDRPLGWRKTKCDVFIKRTVASPDKSFATLTVRQYANQRWWTIERYHEDRKYEDITDVLVFDFGSTPIFCWNYQAAMQLAEYCQLNGPPPGLSWVTACPDDKDGAIEFARKRRIDETHFAVAA